MDAREANVVLTKAALLDPRLKRNDPQERADQARAWAEVLESVSVTDALAAVTAHYATSTEALMPAHVLDRVGDSRAEYPIPSLDATFAADAQRLRLEAGGQRG